MSKILDKVAALLAKAEGTDNEHEAEAYFDAAQRLAAGNSIDLAVARLHTKSKTERETPIRRRITLGVARQRYLSDFVFLFDEIAKPNGVKIDIAHNSTYVLAYGFPSDIDMVETLYSRLVIQMVRAGDAYIKSGEYKSETVSFLKPVYEEVLDWSGSPRRHVARHVWAERPVHGTVARRSFYRGFRNRIGTRISDIVNSAASEAQEFDVISENVATEQTSTALALVERGVEVHDYYKQSSNARGSYRGGRSSGYSANSSSAGSEAGSKARIGNQGSISGSAKAVSA